MMKHHETNESLSMSSHFLQRSSIFGSDAVWNTVMVDMAFPKVTDGFLSVQCMGMKIHN